MGKGPVGFRDDHFQIRIGFHQRNQRFPIQMIGVVVAARHDIDEIQEDMEEIGEDIDELQEDVEEMSEDIEEMNEEELRDKVLEQHLEAKIEAKSDVLVLDPSSEFFKYLKSGGRAGK